jgi:hypothetical protein
LPANWIAPCKASADLVVNLSNCIVLLILDKKILFVKY